MVVVLLLIARPVFYQITNTHAVPGRSKTILLLERVNMYCVVLISETATCVYGSQDTDQHSKQMKRNKLKFNNRKRNLLSKVNKNRGLQKGNSCTCEVQTQFKPFPYETMYY